MLLFASTITEKKKKRETRPIRNKNLENKLEDLKQHTIADYYLHGGY